MGTPFTTVLLALVASLLVVPGPEASQRPLPTRLVMDDSGDGDQAMHTRLDRVVMTSGVKGKRRATVKAEFSSPLLGGDGFAVWFNLDRDPAPEVMTHHVNGDLYFTAHRMSSWTKTNKDISGRCFKARPAGAEAEVVRFNPHCFGKARSFQVSVGLYVGVGEGTLADFAPREHVWSKRIRAHA